MTYEQIVLQKDEKILKLNDELKSKDREVVLLIIILIAVVGASLYSLTGSIF
jgi:hypothetical protein